MIDLLNPQFSRFIPNFYLPGYGTDAEPGTTGWMASLIRPMGERFREGVKILDYGCGGGRLFNFITGYLRDFCYCGAEPEGNRALNIAKSYFGADLRATFLTCEEAVKSPDILRSDAVILGSIFTHCRPETCEDILTTLWPVIDNGGMIIFSAMFKSVTSFYQPGAYGLPDCYGVAFQPEGWIQSLEQKFGHKIESNGCFDCDGGFRQNIFCINKEKK